MNVVKLIKDRVIKAVLGKNAVPVGLVELNKYFRQFGPIRFDFHNEGGMIVGASTNFRYGSIVTHGRTPRELDANIKDAILTSFEVPSSYRKEAAVVRVGATKDAYALA